MPIKKRATLGGRVVISKTLLECPNCGHRDVSDGGIDVSCPKCKTKMLVAFCSAGEKEESEQD